MTNIDDPDAPVRKAIMHFMVLLESLAAKPGLMDTQIGEKTGTLRSNGPNIRKALQKHLHLTLVEEKIGKKTYHRLSAQDADRFRLLVPRSLDWQQLLILSWLVNNRPRILGAYAPQEMRKLKTSLGLVFPEDPDTSMLKLRRCTYFSPVGKTNDHYNSWHDEEAGACFLEELYTAMDECRSLVIGFVKRSGEEETRVFNPVLFFEKQGTSYILVEDADSKALRILRPNSIRSISDALQPGNQTEIRRFVLRPLEFYHRFIDCTFGNFYPGSEAELVQVRVRFSPQVADYVDERVWTSDDGQTCTREANGDAILTLRTFINHELIRWLTGFGADARVLEPESLAQAVKEQHQKALDCQKC